MTCKEWNTSGGSCRGTVFRADLGNDLCHYHTPAWFKEQVEREKAINNDIEKAKDTLEEIEAQLAAAHREVTKLERMRDQVRDRLIKLRRP